MDDQAPKLPMLNANTMVPLGLIGTLLSVTMMYTRLEARVENNEARLKEYIGVIKDVNNRVYDIQIAMRLPRVKAPIQVPEDEEN